MENIYSYRERGARLKPAAILGSKEMLTSIMASTLTTLCVFIPMIIWKDDLEMIGEIFSDMIFTVVISLIVSLIVAVTVVPALSSNFLKLYTRKQKPLKNKLLIRMDKFLEGIIGSLEKAYKKTLVFALSHRALVLTFIGTLLVLSFLQFSHMGMTFMPRSSADDTVTIDLTMPVGTSLERTEQSLISMKNVIEDEVQGYEYILLSVGSEGGRSGDKTYVGSIEIILPQLEDQTDSPTAIIAKLRPYLNQFAGAQFEFSAGRGFRQGSEVDIILYGNDMDSLTDFSFAIRDLLDEQMPQVEDPLSSLDGGVPEYQIDIDKDRASSLGISVSDVATAVSAYVEGLTPTTMWYGDEELDLQVRLRESDRDSLPDLDSQFIASSSGEQIALSNVAHFVQGYDIESINREDKTRVAHVTADLADLADGYNIAQVQPQLEQLIDGTLVVPDGIEIFYRGDSEDLEEMKNPFFVVILVAFLMVFAVMASLFESFKDPFIIFLSIPLLMIGVVLTYTLTGETFSLFSAIGIVVLLGIVVNNGIVLVDYTNLLRFRGMPLVEACIEAGRSRFRPVLMASLTTILGMIPLGFFPGEGMEMIQPIAQTVVGGLSANTLLTLFFIPVMYSLINKDRSTFSVKERLNRKIETLRGDKK